MTESQQQQLCCLLLDTGEKLIESGAEISRVEDTLKRIAKAYGTVHMNVFVITSSISLTLAFSDNRMITHTRRINHSASTNFHIIEEINRLSRECAEKGLTLDEFEAKLKEAVKPQGRFIIYLGSVIATFGFCIFFKGTLADSIVSAVLGIIICMVQATAGKLMPNRVMFFLTTSFITGLLAGIMVKVFPGLHLDKILIGDIMLLTPGLALTNAIRDAMVGDTISGSMKLIESIIWAGAIAFGIMAAIWMVRV